jgi:hypothetical protein
MLFQTLEALLEVILLQVVQNGRRNLPNLFHGFKACSLEVALRGTEEDALTWNEIGSVSGMFVDWDRNFSPQTPCRKVLCASALTRCWIHLSRNISDHTTNPLSQTFQTLHTKLLDDTLTGSKNSRRTTPLQSNKSTLSWLLIPTFRGYLGWGMPVDFQCMLFPFLSQHHTEKFNVHTCWWFYSVIPHYPKFITNIRSNFLLRRSWWQERFFGTILAQTFFTPEFSCQNQLLQSLYSVLLQLF